MPNAFKQGDHICAIYDTEEEQLAVAAEFVAAALGAGERAVYVGASPAALSRFDDALDEEGIDAAAMLERGALIELTHAEAHLSGGRFDSDRMLHFLHDTVERALNAGFKGLRICGDMSWLLLEPPGASQLVEYESQLTPFFREIGAAGMCQYDRAIMQTALVDRAAASHPSVVIHRQYMPNPSFRT